MKGYRYPDTAAAHGRKFIDGSGELFGAHDETPACAKHMCVPTNTASDHRGLAKGQNAQEGERP